MDAQLLQSPQTWADPHPVYAALRPHSPVALDAGGERILAALKSAQVKGVLRDHASFASDVAPLAGPAVLLRNDPPFHTALRATINRAFTPRHVAAFEPWVAAIARDLLDGIEGPEIDVVDALTTPLPVRVIARLLGVPESDYRLFKGWSDRVIRGDAEASQALALYIAEVAIRRDRDAETLLNELIDAEVDGRQLTLSELLGFVGILLIAGNETTTNLMSNMLGILAVRPELYHQLRHNRSLVEPFIEETLRFESPVQLVYRRATRDTHVGGVPVPAGTAVALYFGAANRDPELFANPDEFDLARDQTQHLAFGHGIHFCIGAPLARLEASLVLNGFLDRFDVLEPGHEPARRMAPGPNLFGYESLPLRLSRCHG